ncbi:metal ABC transporter permease [Treponema succinifaciens]|uniref:metal ABC transporter permease n=1 Tax=Treponema succinifaciens TaxID=167 RepID=UPI003FCE5DA4
MKNATEKPEMLETSMEILEKLSYYLSFSFVRYALIVGILVSLCASLLGTVLVLRRYSLIGDGLSHAAFGAYAVAVTMKLVSDSLLTIPVTVLCAVFLLCLDKKRKVQSDSLIAMISVGALAFGYLVMNVFSTSANVSGDVCTTLFGSTSILTLTKGKVAVSVLISCVTIAAFVFFYNRIFSATFDPDFLRTEDRFAGIYDILVAVITAVVIVLAMNLVGSLLITAILVFPPLSAMRIMKSFKSTVIYSAALGAFSSFLGIMISIVLSTPVGATIVIIDIMIFALHCVAGRFL